MRLTIGGNEFTKCGFCEDWYSELICPCFYKKQENEIDKLLKTFQHQNEVFILCIPNRFELNMSPLQSD